MSHQKDASLDHVAELAQQLAPRDQARLIAQLVASMADARPANTVISEDAWDAWCALRQDIAQHFPDAHLAERLKFYSK